MAKATLSKHEACLRLRGGWAPGRRLAGGRHCGLGHDGLQWPVRTAYTGRAPPLVQARALHVLAAVLLQMPATITRPSGLPLAGVTL